jgi:crossover junction endodeoxyribonuclease RuvC
MNVIGIDPGLARCGYGVIRVDRVRALGDRSGPEPVCYGCIETVKEKRTAERLLEIHTALDVILETYQPAQCAIEKLFFSKNITSAINVAEVRGIVLLSAEERRIPITEYTPNQAKQAITGPARADKHQLQEMIRRLLRLAEVPKPDDAADALSIALCHIHAMRLP